LSSSEKISVAVIGVGYLGQWHARKLAALERARLVAVVDTERSRCNGLASELECLPVTDYRKIPEMARAAVIAVPTQEHFEVALHLLEAGMDLLIEKPIGADLEKATILVETAEKADRTLAVGLVERFNPGVVAGIEAIKNPRWIEARRLAPFKERTRNVDVVRDLMIHDLDIARTIAKSEGEVVNVVATSVLTGLPDSVRAHVHFKNGIKAFLEASRLHYGETRHVQVIDDDGRLLIDTCARAAFRYRPGPLGMEPRVLPTTPTDPLEEELRDFIDAVADHTRPRVTGRDGLESLKLATEVLKRIDLSEEA